MCFGGVSSVQTSTPRRWRPDEPGLHLITRADATGWAADVAQAADRREPVGVLDVRDDCKGLLGRDGQGDVGACLDHGWSGA